MEGWLDRPDGTRWWWSAAGPAHGPTVLLVPPGNRNAAVWPPRWRAGLHAAGWRTLRVDLPGQGRSVLGAAGFDVDRLAGDLAALLGEAMPGATDGPAETAAFTEGATDGPAETRAFSEGAREHAADHSPGRAGGVDGSPGVGPERTNRAQRVRPESIDEARDVDAAESGDRARHVGHGRVHLVGAGLGGTVAMALAERLPAASLTLVAASGWYVDPAMPGAEEPVMVSLLLRQERHTPELLRRALLREVRALAGPLDREQAGTWPDLVDSWLAHGQQPDDPHRRALLEAAPRWTGLASLAVPTSVVHGSDDPLIPLVHGERLAAAVPGAELHVVTGAGHHLGAALLDAVAAALHEGRSGAAL